MNVVTPVSKLDPDYIALAITYSKAHDDLAKRAQGKSVVHVHGNDIAEVEIPCPSESEQKRISTVVLGLDSLSPFISVCVSSSAFAAWVKNQFRINSPSMASNITLPASHTEDARVAISAGLRHH